MRFKSSFLLFFVVVLLSACSSRAFLNLSRGEFMQLKSDLQQLEKSTLIIRLYTNNPKVKALRRSGNKKALTNYIKDRKKYMALMMDAWSNNYDFSETIYMPDSLFKAFQMDRSGTYFLNKSLDLDPSIQLKTDDYFVLGRGERDLAFIWFDDNAEKLDPQPPVNFDKLTPWEMIQGTEKFLNYRVKDANDYFYNVIKSKENEQ